MPLSTIGPIVFAVYLGAMVAIGLVAFRSQKTSEDFWVAGRRFGVPMMVMANVAALVHGGAIMSHLAFAGHIGGVAITTSFACVLGFAVILFFFAKKLRASGGFTLPDYMGDRFDSQFLRAWSAFVVALTSVIYLIAQIRGMGFILESLLGIDVLWGQLLGTVIFVSYVALGGLLAIVWTNAAQFLMMWLGLVVVAVGVSSAAGGWFEVLSAVEKVAPGWTSPTGVTWSWTFLLSWYILVFVAYSTRLELVTKVFAARDDKVARRALPWTTLIVMGLLVFTGVYLGAAARVLVWDSIATPDQAFPALVAQTLTPALAAIALTGVACAIMSTTDSLLLMSGAAIAHDVVRKCVHEPRGIAKDERYYLRISRYAIVVIGALAFFGSVPDIALILELVAYALGIVGASFFFPLLVGLTSRRVSRQAAVASSVWGGLTTAVWTVLTLTDVSWAKVVHPILPGLFISGLLMFTLTPFGKPVSGEALRRFFPEEVNGG